MENCSKQSTLKGFLWQLNASPEEKCITSTLKSWAELGTELSEWDQEIYSYRVPDS